MSLVNDISKDICRVLADSLERHKDRVNQDAAPAFVGMAALAHALAIQVVVHEVSDQVAMRAFLKTIRNVREAFETGTATNIIVHEVDLTTPKAKA